MIDIVERCRNHSAPWAQEAAHEIERLRDRVSQLVMALDMQHGTPCEQIRHTQEVECLRAELVSYRRALATSEAVNAELLEALRAAYAIHGMDTGPGVEAAIEKADIFP